MNSEWNLFTAHCFLFKLLPKYDKETEARKWVKKLLWFYHPLKLILPPIVFSKTLLENSLKTRKSCDTSFLEDTQSDQLQISTPMLLKQPFWNKESLRICINQVPNFWKNARAPTVSRAINNSNRSARVFYTSAIFFVRAFPPPRKPQLHFYGERALAVRKNHSLVTSR